MAGLYNSFASLMTETTLQVAKQYIHGRWPSHGSDHKRLGQAGDPATRELEAHYHCGHFAFQDDANSHNSHNSHNSQNCLIASAEPAGFRGSCYGRRQLADCLNDFLQIRPFYFETST